jgi:hypothetical protein
MHENLRQYIEKIEVKQPAGILYIQVRRVWKCGKKTSESGV